MLSAYWFTLTELFVQADVSNGRLLQGFYKAEMQHVDYTQTQTEGETGIHTLLHGQICKVTGTEEEEASFSPSGL